MPRRDEALATMWINSRRHFGKQSAMSKASKSSCADETPSEYPLQPKRFPLLVAALSAGYLAAGAVANAVRAESQALVALTLMTILSMVVGAFSGARPRVMIAGFVVASVLSLGVVYGWRRLFDPAAAVGPVPESLELMALAALGAVNILAGTIVALAFSAGTRVFRARWIVFGATGAALFAFCVFVSHRAAEANSPQELLRRVILLEQSLAQSDSFAQGSWGQRQELSTALAILGRQREAREIPLSPDQIGQTLCETPDPTDSDPPFAVTPWREAMSRIAHEQRLVLIMEAHTVTEHRAWIEQTLGAFREAGFTRYFA